MYIIRIVFILTTFDLILDDNISDIQDFPSEEI